MFQRFTFRGWGAVLWSVGRKVAFWGTFWGCKSETLKHLYIIIAYMS